MLSVQAASRLPDTLRCVDSRPDLISMLFYGEFLSRKTRKYGKENHGRPQGAAPTGLPHFNGIHAIALTF
jgi:hypothetical protein